MTQRQNPARSILAMRAQRDAWAYMAGEPLTVPYGRFNTDAHPTLPAPCRCANPVQDEDTCVLCGKGLP